MRHRTSIISYVLATILLGLAGNVYTNTISISSSWKPWSLMVFAALASVVVIYEVRRNEGGTAGTQQGWINMKDTIEMVSEALRVQWAREEGRRKIRDPYPLPVRWHVATSRAVDTWANVCRASPATATFPESLNGTFKDVLRTYNAVPSQRLIVLGEAGSGKTILVIRLAIELLDSRLPRDPIPVVFTIGSWDPTKMTLERWMTDQLIRNHPGLAYRSSDGDQLALELIEAGRILPIFDGFDEIAAGLRDLALTTLSAGTISLVLTSRPAEYAETADRVGPLSRAAGIEMDRLPLDEVAEYLPQAISAPSGAADNSYLSGRSWVAVFDYIREHPNEPRARNVSEVLSLPLMVTLARTVFSNNNRTAPTDLLDIARFPSTQALEEFLLAGFIPAAFNQLRSSPRHRSDRSARRATAWLSLIAWHLDQEASTDIAWWQFNRRAPRTFHAIAGGLPFGLPAAILAYLVYGPFGAVLAGVAAVLVTGIPGGLVSWRQITPSTVHLLLPRTLSGIVRPLRFGAMVGMAAGTTASAVAELIGGGGGLWTGVGVFAAITLALGLRELLDARADLSHAATPSSTLRDDLVSGSIHGLSGYLVGALLTLAVSFALGVNAGVLAGLTYGVAYGFAFATGLRNSRTSTASYSFMVARLWLVLTGHLPWSLMSFLDQAHAKGVLRQIGPVYQFRHIRLQQRLVEDLAAKGRRFLLVSRPHASGPVPDKRQDAGPDETQA